MKSDCLNFADLSNIIATRINGYYCVDVDGGKCKYEPRAIDTFGVFGAWGSGKSSILALVRAHCSKDIAWLDFDAIKYQTEEMILVPLLHRIAEECGDEDSARLFSGLIKALGAFAADVIVATSGIPIEKQLTKLTGIIQNIPASEPSPADKLPKSRARAIVEAFDELITLLKKKKKAKRIVIAIDNLDRARPRALLEILEAIHLLLCTNNVTFVLAMDQGACLRCISKAYGFSPSESALYLEKMIPDYFRVPDPWVGPSFKTAAPEDAIRKFLIKLMEVEECELIRKHTRLLWEVIGSTAILRNPRRIKRLLRWLASFSKTWWEQYDDQILAVVFLAVVSDVWPELYAAISITHPDLWTSFIQQLAQGQSSDTPLEAFVDAAFYEFILALADWKKGGKGFKNIQDYDSLDQLLGEMKVLGL